MDYIINNRSNSTSAVFGKNAIPGSHGLPLCLPFWKLCAPFGSHWRSKRHFCCLLDARGRTFLRRRARRAFFIIFGVPEVETAYSGGAAAICGKIRKLRSAPRGDVPAWVSARSAIFQARAAV